MSNSNGNEGFETKAIHAGQECDQCCNLEMNPPIVTSLTNFQHDPTNMQVIKQVFDYNEKTENHSFIFRDIAIVIQLVIHWSDVWRH